MSKKLVPLLLLVALLAALLPMPAAPVERAEADEVWIEVDTAEELAEIGFDATTRHGSYKLTADINLSGYDNGDHKGWNPIGSNGTPFTGKFDGNGYTIRNMTIERSNQNNVGLFGNTSGATLTNIRLLNAVVKGQDSVGGIAGFMDTTRLYNSSVYGSITGSRYVGGLAGYAGTSYIADSYTSGSMQFSGALQNYLGGLVGYFTNYSIDRSYSTMVIPTVSGTGGLVGENPPGLPIHSSFWDTVKSGTSSSEGGTGKTTAEMKTKDTYAYIWDFDDVWGMIEGSTYPLLRSEYNQVALNALIVKNASDNAELTLNRTFTSDYGAYSTRVVNKTDRIVVAGTALNGTSAVSVNTGTAEETLDLNPGQNDFTIRVTAPGGLTADYSLTVYRDAGTAQYPHRITTADQLSRIGQAAEGYGLGDAYALEADLDLSGFGAGAGWTPIGNAATPFTGTFDGKQHGIANLTVNRPGTAQVGLFGVTDGAVLSNVALLNARVTGGNQTGGLAGSASNTAVSAAAVQGAVYGVNTVGGLIGQMLGVSSVSESYSAAFVSGASGTGGLLGEGASATVTNSFWDTESSGQSASAGGTGRSTSAMMSKSTYTTAGWTFGDGQRWGIVEGTTYPLPYAGFSQAALSGLNVGASGAFVSMSGGFNAMAGVYTATLNTPAATASVTATPAAGGAAVTINGGAGTNVALSLGNTPAEIKTTSPNGLWQVVYKVTIVVPTPKPISVQGPANGLYGIGGELNMTVTYDHPVTVSGTPLLPLPGVGAGGAEASAVYVGQPAGQPAKLNFRYTVQAGDSALAGLAPGSALTVVGAGITSIGDAVSLALPTPLPAWSSARVDGLVPTITLTPSTTAPTNTPVTVTAAAYGTGSDVSSLKWEAGTHAASYFAGGGTAVAGNSFQAADNGSYTVFAADEAGNTAVETITIANITTQSPSLALDYSPRAVNKTGVEISVTATAQNTGAGNSITALKWAAGLHAAGAFADPAFGTAVPGGNSFHAAQNGTYTVYAKDAAGNNKAETITIGNIITQPPTLDLDYGPKTLNRTGVEVSVTASVYDSGAGNTIEALKWAPGLLAAGDFADPAFGTAVPNGGSFHAAESGSYTVWAQDSAGNTTIETIAIGNIVTQLPTLILDYSPKTAVYNTDVEISVTASAYDGGTGNALAGLKWAPGLRTVLDFADPAFGTDVPPAGVVPVRENGVYSFYAVDTVGNARVATVEITNFWQPEADAGTPAGPLPDTNTFVIQPGQAYTLTIQGLTLQIPAGAITQRTTITMKKATADAQARLQPGQALWSEAYALTKDVAGKFASEIALSVQWNGQGSEQRPSLYYYDEEAKAWVELGGQATGGVLTGKTDHFTLFAVMPASVTPPANPQPAFSDLAGHWAEKPIREAVVSGLVEGYPNGTFRPDHSITRAEFAVLLDRLLNWPAGGALSFADQAAVPAWARDAVSGAVQAGVISGYEDRTFRPDANITRAEIAVLIAKAAGLTAGATAPSAFADGAEIAGWARGYVEAAREAKLLEGQTGNRFNPQANATRAEAVVLLQRLAAYLKH